MDPITMSMMASAGSSILGGIFGGKKKNAGGQQSIPPFQQWPKEVQDMWLEKVVKAAPGVTTDREFQAGPLTRIGAPTGDPFDNEQLYEWQKYSDEQGGLFDSVMPKEAAPEAAKQRMVMNIAGTGRWGDDGTKTVMFNDGTSEDYDAFLENQIRAGKIQPGVGVGTDFKRFIGKAF